MEGCRNYAHDKQHKQLGAYASIMYWETIIAMGLGSRLVSQGENTKEPKYYDPYEHAGMDGEIYPTDTPQEGEYDLHRAMRESRHQARKDKRKSNNDLKSHKHKLIKLG